MNYTFDSLPEKWLKLSTWNIIIVKWKQENSYQRRENWIRFFIIKFSKFLNLVIKIENYLSTFYLPHSSTSSPQRKKRRKCNFLQNTALSSLQSLSPPCMLNLILNSFRPAFKASCPCLCVSNLSPTEFEDSAEIENKKETYGNWNRPTSCCSF